MAENYGTIHFILTGGTMDSDLDTSKDAIVPREKSTIPEYLEKLKLHNPVKYSSLFLKDSRDIRYKDREKLLEAVKKSDHKMIIITHGTYTMPDSGQYLKDHLPKNDKTIILTGSMTPLKGFDLSDAPFNIGYAIAKVQALPPNVYLCMNGKVFDPDQVDKNRLNARFEEI